MEKKYGYVIELKNGFFTYTNESKKLAYAEVYPTLMSASNSVAFYDLKPARIKKITVKLNDRVNKYLGMLAEMEAYAESDTQKDLNLEKPIKELREIFEHYLEQVPYIPDCSLGD